MTKQTLAFLFCFIRELTLYSPLTLSLTSARELKPCVCVFITTAPNTKLCTCVGGGYWRTCATRDDEPRLVWTSLPTRH